VIDPVGLDKLFPDWRADADCSRKTQVKDDCFFWFTETGAIKLPKFIMPPLMNNHHCYLGSLGNVCRWLARKAEALGVEIYPGFAAAEVLYDEKGAVKGIATGDMASAVTENRRTPLPAAWNCSVSTRCSPKARAAA
jgi:electron-transferring-flavoprotein dehydrogenase